ncbi:phasin family protein [Paraburkholderia sp. C35]|jgi:hypothetical protein|uniref:phasin family protein n=1 Tax=Paraburkholderia sp. C35 TaxID=2126993 RepID=UPI000D69F430|nr:phasin family protein [Paraburkholderia sp. C35]
MNTRNSVGVISAWEPGISALHAWAIPAVREAQSIAALNLQMISQFNGEALKALSTIGSARSVTDVFAIQSDAANQFVALCAAYGQQFGQIVSRMNVALQEVGQTQAKTNDLHLRSVVDTFQSRTQAAASAVTSAVATALGAASTPEALAQQQTEDAIAHAARPGTAVVDQFT